MFRATDVTVQKAKILRKWMDWSVGGRLRSPPTHAALEKSGYDIRYLCSHSDCNMFNYAHIYYEYINKPTNIHMYVCFYACMLNSFNGCFPSCKCVYVCVCVYIYMHLYIVYLLKRLSSSVHLV